MIEWLFADSWMLVVFFAVVFYWLKKFLEAKPEVKEVAKDVVANKAIDLLKRYIK